MPIRSARPPGLFSYSVGVRYRVIPLLSRDKRGKNIQQATITKFMVPESFLEFCDQLMRENKTLRATSNTQGAASSTKVYEDRARNIRLQDTYTCQYPANSTHDDVSSPQVHLQDRPQPLLANRTRAWGRGETSREEKYLRTVEPVEQKTLR